jgi:hypothetical protein
VYSHVLSSWCAIVLRDGLWRLLSTHADSSCEVIEATRSQRASSSRCEQLERYIRLGDWLERALIPHSYYVYYRLRGYSRRDHMTVGGRIAASPFSHKKAPCALGGDKHLISSRLCVMLCHLVEDPHLSVTCHATAVLQYATYPLPHFHFVLGTLLHAAFPWKFYELNPFDAASNHTQSIWYTSVIGEWVCSQVLDK